ncbi:MAG: peptidase M12 [Betaproteobacteria bacterium]|nr:peptidase M12 [Betaproteobacteria bacterium]
MAKSSKPAARSRKRVIHMCCDRILTGAQKVRAMELAVQENPANGPPPPPPHRKLFGASSAAAPAKMALIAGKKWQSGRVLGVWFMDGTPTQRAKVRQQAVKWEPFANIRFDFTAPRASAQIRISFQADSGSWSYIGTDNLAIAKSQPTMNFGWLRDDTDDTEYERVVVHEFGHALGAIHEHQNPEGGIQWNLPAVYAYFSGPPNFWSKAETDQNVVQKYSVTQLNASTFDRKSIMLYHFDGALIKGGVGTPNNTRLSAGDKRFIRKQYPR